MEMKTKIDEFKDLARETLSKLKQSDTAKVAGLFVAVGGIYKCCEAFLGSIKE